MSGIETDVKPILTPLLQGERITLLEKPDRNILEKWIALKVMTTECIDIADAVLTQTERDLFRRTSQIPWRLRIWIAPTTLEIGIPLILTRHYELMLGLLKLKIVDSIIYR